jgi:hypothetical protein
VLLHQHNLGDDTKKKGTGTLWRIRRTSGPRGERPPQPRVVPIYALRAAGIVGAVGLTGWAIRPLTDSLSE